MENSLRLAASALKRGEAPEAREMLESITVGMGGLVDFIRQKYFEDYISKGGSKIKFITGKAGSGKTHLARLLRYAAEDLGFTAVGFSARDVWLHDFKEVYAEIFKKSDLTAKLTKCAAKIAAELGYDLDDVPAGITFADYLSSIGELDALTKKEIRNQLREMFLKNPLIDNNFAIACGLLTGSILGHPVLESANAESLLSWLAGEKDVKLAALRSLGLSPAKITKYNARHMLRSLAEVCRLASCPGIIVMIDNAEALVSSTSLDVIRYTKLKREDTYESIRELIDEIDTLRNVMFFYLFDRELIDNELSGIKSYQALWMRIQNEIASPRFNAFTDIIDLDRYAAETFTAETVREMSERVAEAVNAQTGGAQSIGIAAAEKILTEARFAKVSALRQIVLATVLGEEWETAL
ncbi:MAG: ATP-binding protein [Oscillospiraceae bacterium]|nr:ATP-binding protein [Oscillospiraceae bacterium]